MGTALRILAAVTALLLLSGCGGLGLGDFPRREATSHRPEKDTLVLALSEDVDSLLMDTIDLFEAKLSELSGGNLSLETTFTGEGRLPEAGEWDLAILSNADLMAASEEMSFLSAPFLFPDRESFLTILGNEAGPVRGGREPQKALGGRIVALYYGGAMGFMTRGRFYDAIGFSTSEVGLPTTSEPGPDFYAALPELGARQVVLAGEEELPGLLAAEEIRCMEVRRGSGVPEAAAEKARYYEDTCHRFLGFWLAVADGTDPLVESIVKEAAAYTTEPQNQRRLAAEEAGMAALPESFLGSSNGDYPTIRQAARNLYRKESTRVIVSGEVWNRISPLLPPIPS